MKTYGSSEDSIFIDEGGPTELFVFIHHSHDPRVLPNLCLPPFDNPCAIFAVVAFLNITHKNRSFLHHHLLTRVTTTSLLEHLVIDVSRCVDCVQCKGRRGDLRCLGAAQKNFTSEDLLQHWKQ
jgi:hypothetical protein